MEDWAEVRRLHRSEGMPIKVISRRVGCSKNTVRAALRRDVPPKYERPGGSWSSNPHGNGRSRDRPAQRRTSCSSIRPPVWRGNVAPC